MRQNLATLTLAAIRENAFYEQYVSISLITSPSHRLCPDTNNPLGVENDDTRYITSCYAPPSPRSTNKWAEGRELFSTLAPLLYSFPQFIQSIPSGIVEFVSMLKLVLLLIKKIKVTWMPNWLSKSCLYRNKDHQWGSFHWERSFDWYWRIILKIVLIIEIIIYLEICMWVVME